MNHVLNNDKISCFTRKHSFAKLLPTRQLNVLPRLKLFNAITAFTSLTVFLIKSFTTNKICLHGAVQGLNLNRRYISELEPEMPVTLYMNTVEIEDESLSQLITRRTAGYDFEPI
jgi:hypothetical protein